MSEDISVLLERVRTLSPFFDATVSQHPELFGDDFFESLQSPLDELTLRSRWTRFLEQSQEADMAASLRLLRAREISRVIFRDLSRLADMAETTLVMSLFAGFCIETALEACHIATEERYAPLRDEAGQPVLMTVLGMGKLGAFELNLSSDIDLVFLFEAPGNLVTAKGKQVSYQEFYLRCARLLIAMLDEVTPSGRVFRVDMRLRPYGDSGPLVSHAAAMERYFQEQGRDWERYAFIKARVIAGDTECGDAFLATIKPFVYRRHLDFGAIESLREMKALMARELERKESEDDLKLGAGGIREIEFIVQSQQLLFGGSQPELQQRALVPVLGMLAERELLTPSEAYALERAYVFLRNSEHAIQAERDQQTHLLPTTEQSRERLANAMAEESWAAYVSELDRHRTAVAEVFARLLTPAQEEAEQPLEAVQAWHAFWSDQDELPPAADPLLLQEARELKAAIEVQDLPALSITRIDKLLPIVLAVVAESDDPGLAASRFLPIIRAVLRRTTYLVFLFENRDALKRAVQLVLLSPFLAQQLEAYPILLFELGDRRMSNVSISREALEAELRALLRSLEQGDVEAQMDTLRQFKLAATLKIAAMELLSEISIMQASDALTATAEVILEAALEFAWQHQEAKHGVPCDADRHPLSERFAIIGYGKAGGLELAYGSDLDLVFLCPQEIGASTDGARSVNNNVFYNRLGQRLIHILTSFTRFGILYNVDLRLRPQGNKGPMVATIGAFDRYQREAAWTWEKQALIRARFLAGDTSLGARFSEIRRSALCTAADAPDLQQDVIEMRERMSRHLSSQVHDKSDENEEGGSASFDLKHDSGAIVDIEFMVQYAVLAEAARHEGLTRWTDVMRLLDELGDAGLLNEAERSVLQRSYLAFRASVHYDWLGLSIDYEALNSYRGEVREIWEARMRSRV